MAIPMDEILSGCKKAYERLLKEANGRGILIMPKRFFPKEHFNTYWGYFRDAGWLTNVRDEDDNPTPEYTLLASVEFDEQAIKRVRAIRNTKRTQARNARIREASSR